MAATIGDRSASGASGIGSTRPAPLTAGPATTTRSLSAPRSATAAAIASWDRSAGARANTGSCGPISALGPCITSAPLTASACSPQISLNFKAVSRATARQSPRPTTISDVRSFSHGTAADQSDAIAAANGSGRRIRPADSSTLSATAATSRAPWTRLRTNVLVAATARSSPASIGSVSSAASANGLAGSLTRATVKLPAARAARTGSTTSGLRPLCDTARVSAREKSSGARAMVTIDGGRLAGISPACSPNRRPMYSATLSELPRAMVTSSAGSKARMRAAAT